MQRTTELSPAGPPVRPYRHWDGQGPWRAPTTSPTTVDPTAARPGTERWLQATGGGVSEAEHADDGGTYGVEVILESRRHAEVKLDDFHVVHQAIDDDGSGQNGADGG